MRAKAACACVLLSMAVGCSDPPEGPSHGGPTPIDAGATDHDANIPSSDASTGGGAKDAEGDAPLDESQDPIIEHPIKDAGLEEGGPVENDASVGDASFDAPDDEPDADLDAGVDPEPEPDASDDAPTDVDEAEVPEDDAGPYDDAGPSDDGGSDDGGAGGGSDGGMAVPDEPTCLEDAGLYADFQARLLAPGIRFYKPAFELWSDGAYKVRHVYFPEGSTIDTSDPDEWIFPVGSRFYKTFHIDGRPIETRFLQKLENGWFAATYAWNADGTATTRVTQGVRNALGTHFDIPDQTTCKGCHGGGSDWVLGFELFSLVTEGAEGLTVPVMNAEGLLSPPLHGDYRIPGDPLTQKALGWLHGNCGTGCHNHRPTAKGHWSGFHVHLHTRELGSVQHTAVFRTGVGVLSTFQPESGGPLLYRLAPGKPDRSAVVYRISRRGTTEQMPPMATELVDHDAVALMRAFIESLK